MDLVDLPSQSHRPHELQEGVRVLRRGRKSRARRPPGEAAGAVIGAWARREKCMGLLKVQGQTEPVAVVPVVGQQEPAGCGHWVTPQLAHSPCQAPVQSAGVVTAQEPSAWQQAHGHGISPHRIPGPCHQPRQADCSRNSQCPSAKQHAPNGYGQSNVGQVSPGYHQASEPVHSASVRSSWQNPVSRQQQAPVGSRQGLGLQVSPLCQVPDWAVHAAWVRFWHEPVGRQQAPAGGHWTE
jgi:hypothetical protein